jgi:hypothetical protein
LIHAISRRNPKNEKSFFRVTDEHPSGVHHNRSRRNSIACVKVPRLVVLRPR